MYLQRIIDQQSTSIILIDILTKPIYNTQIIVDDYEDAVQRV